MVLLLSLIHISPANKRAVWQTVRIAEEVKKSMGCEPAKIFVEMARGGEKEKKTVSYTHLDVYKRQDEQRKTVLLGSCMRKRSFGIYGDTSLAMAVRSS